MGRFLPISREDMHERGWETADFLFISGDAYVDHPGFGPALLCRLLEAHGYKVALIPQPNWRSDKDFTVMGRPRLAFLVSAGNMDSLLNRYTAAKKIRRQDAYSPGGKAGFRPDRATIVYTRKLKALWPEVPVIIGGIEASLRRFAHYDYWADEVRPSILTESGADLLIYGMGERALLRVAADLHQGVGIESIQDIPGTCYQVPGRDYVGDYVEMPGFAAVNNDKKAFARAFKIAYTEQNPFKGRRLIQEQREGFLVQNPPSPPLTTAEMDEVYDLPYERRAHPKYDQTGGIPALKEVQFSIVSQRGCFGGCHFCAIHSHEGRIIQNRSHESILREALGFKKMPEFKGYIHDVGGPTANFRQPACLRQKTEGACRDRACLTPKPCPNLKADHQDYLSLLRKLRTLPGVKKVFIRSGVRYDYLLLASDDFLTELCKHHVSGQLKVAPEHISPKVTALMGKPGREVYEQFVRKFYRTNEKLGLRQYLVPYFMSSHPGATLKDAVELALFIRDSGAHPKQVQDFIPTPGTVATCMYYTGINPLTGEKVYVAKSSEEKKLQRALMQYWLPENRNLVLKALKLTRREDLIGSGPKCLINAQRGRAQGRKKVRSHALSFLSAAGQ